MQITKSIFLTKSGKKLEIKLMECSTPWSKAKGLMFSRKKKASALLFTFKNYTKTSIHSLFVFYPFLAIWLSDKKIIEKKLVTPFSLNIKPTQRFNKLIEIPLNNNYKSIIEFIVDNRKL